LTVAAGVVVEGRGDLDVRRQLAVVQREQPRAHSRLTRPDRAWLALLAGTLPASRLAAMRLIITPGTIMRWRRSGRPPVLCVPSISSAALTRTDE
jgi:hypothetical protein